MVIKPATWGARRFLATEQVFVWELRDARKQSLELRLPFEPLNPKGIETLEALRPQRDKTWGVVGRIIFRHSNIYLCPWTLLRPGGRAASPLHHLGLDDSPVTPGAARPTSPRRPYDEDVETDGTEQAAPDPISNWRSPWGDLEDQLQSVAESGPTRLGSTGQECFAKQTDELRDLGLAPLADCLAHLRQRADIPRAVLQAKYLCTLFREMAIRVALESEATAAVAGP